MNLHNRKKIRPSRWRPTRMGVIMNRVANQFADGGTISHPSADYLPFYYILLKELKKKRRKTPIMRSAIVMDGILRLE